jgi:hypothetical protein
MFFWFSFEKKKFRLDLIEFSLFWLHNQLYLIKGWLERVKSSKYKRGKIIKITEISQQSPPLHPVLLSVEMR